MIKKIEESIKVRKDKNFQIIARTDANTVEGIDKTLIELSLRRCRGRYNFPEAMKDEKEFEK